MKFNQSRSQFVILLQIRDAASSLPKYEVSIEQVCTAAGMRPMH